MTAHQPNRKRNAKYRAEDFETAAADSDHMAFCSIFIPNFMMQAVVRCEPVLRDCALALIDGRPPVWSVVAFNEAAAKAGISLGMTKSQVQQFRGQFCRIEIRHRSPAREKAAHAALLDLGWSFSPRVEDTAPDAILLDLAGLNSLFGSEEGIAAQLSKRASNLGLFTQIAVASKIEVAIVAARGFAGITIILEGKESESIGNLPVNSLSPTSEVLETLDRWGVRTCAALAGLPVVQLSERLGQEGVRLHELAQGRSERSIVLAEPALQFKEEMELEDAVEELEPLAFLMDRLLGQLCARLSARSLAACAVRVRFESDPSFEADSARQRRSGGPQSSQRKAGKHGESCFERVLSLPTPIRNSKTLLNLLRLHLQSDPPSAPILKIALAVDATRPRIAQGGLFLPSFPDPEKLELTIARLANVVGDSNIGSPELVDTHRPGELRTQRFVAADAVEPRGDHRKVQVSKQDVNHPSGTTTPSRARDDSWHSAWPACRQARLRAGLNATAAPLLRKSQDDTKVEAAATISGTKIPHATKGLRIFRPPLPARVELREGCPARVGFQGMSGHVVRASGPWRSSGDWWREDDWQNDEWDLEIVFFPSLEAKTTLASVSKLPGGVAAPAAKDGQQRGLYRIFFDSVRKEWFVRGAYD
jgi:protein ImuB